MIHDDDHIDELIGRNGRFQTTVRTYNVLRREGIDTIGAFMALTKSEVMGYRGAREAGEVEGYGTQPGTWDEVARIQGEVSDPRKRPAKAPGESQTSFTIRLMLWEAWWQGHDAACDRGWSCLLHENAHQDA